MTHRVAYLIFAGLALAAVPPAMSAAPAARALGHVEILVNGVVRPRYAHDGRWYVEALKGREYAIRIRNPYGVRAAVALSVDGLNTIDARQTTAAAAGKWVLGPHETVTISGWQTSRTEARRFEFTTEERWYGHALGKTDNLGVIAAVFFKERQSSRMTEALKDNRQQSAPAPSAKNENEYAATGMGDRTAHAVSQVWLDLEDAPAQTVNIRYEFRPQLVKLGVLTPVLPGPLERRERARGFEPGFCPEPPKR